MHDPRASTALRQLANLGREPDPPRWRWDIVGLEGSGRLVLPAEARAMLGAAGQATSVEGVCNRVALVLRPTGAAAGGGGGAVMAVDRRGRLCVPMWTRRASAGSGVVVVGTQRGAPVVLVASVGVLDGLGDVLAGGLR